METILSICAGIGLAAACGFRVFVPLLVLPVLFAAGLCVIRLLFSSTRTNSKGWSLVFSGR